MDALFDDFKQAHHQVSGPLLATTITPFAPASDPIRLRKFSRETNDYSIATDVRYQITHYDRSVQIKKQEANAWIEVYIAFWKSLGPILESEDDSARANWSRIYERWKDVTNALIKGYSAGHFEAWTVPCLYVVGKYLRAFAIKADANSKATNGGLQMKTGGFGDDIASDVGKNEKLEDAARVINRIFTLCISDRYVDRMGKLLQLASLDLILSLHVQSTIGRVEEVGHLLHNQSPIQDVFQGSVLRKMSSYCSIFLILHLS